jgi:hypothetical protein
MIIKRGICKDELTYEHSVNLFPEVRRSLVRRPHTMRLRLSPRQSRLSTQVLSWQSCLGDDPYCYNEWTSIKVRLFKRTYSTSKISRTSLTIDPRGRPTTGAALMAISANLRDCFKATVVDTVQSFGACTRFEKGPCTFAMIMSAMGN